MKRLFVVLLIAIFAVGTAGLAVASEKKKLPPLRAGEKEVHKEFASLIPADKKIDVFKLHEVWKKAMADPNYRKNVYLIDVRSHEEFYAFHIRGTDHIHAGHMYTIPKKIKNADAEIYVWCRTSRRAQYVAGFLYKYGYKNVHCVVGKGDNKGGVVGWAQAGFPFVNQFAGEFKITKYSKYTMEEGEYIVREFHPY